MIERISKILDLSNQQDLEIDEELYNKTPGFSKDPLFIAGDCLFTVLRECGLNEDDSDLARRIFVSLKQPKSVDIRERLFSIASSLSIENFTIEKNDSVGSDFFF